MAGTRKCGKLERCHGKQRDMSTYGSVHPPSGGSPRKTLMPPFCNNEWRTMPRNSLRLLIDSVLLRLSKEITSFSIPTISSTLYLFIYLS
ncbi:hypothetical protein TNCV_4499041 [Trichonephila clavipes]|nr:hypothetical protein TNCV_4499041 [Trichonephila clavipes]